MQWIETASEYLKNIKTYANTIDLYDVAEILIIAFLLYSILAWMKTTRSWRVLRGLVVIVLFLLVVDLMQMTTIIWMTRNVLGFAVTAIIVAMQPELRQALEQLGEKNFLPSFSSSSRKMEDTFSEKTVGEIVKACVEMGKVKTGALIVVERKESLKDYERTGIEVDGLVTSQLLINIFEHNTPLHDGAVVIRGNRVAAATCYLPLSDNGTINKALGTRHRAAVGISEMTDSLTIVVSEETGRVSLAEHGNLRKVNDADSLSRELGELFVQEGSGSRFKLWKGRLKDEKKTDK